MPNTDATAALGSLLFIINNLGEFSHKNNNNEDDLGDDDGDGDVDAGGSSYIHVVQFEEKQKENTEWEKQNKFSNLRSSISFKMFNAP